MIGLHLISSCSLVRFGNKCPSRTSLTVVVGVVVGVVVVVVGSFVWVVLAVTVAVAVIIDNILF